MEQREREPRRLQWIGVEKRQRSFGHEGPPTAFQHWRRLLDVVHEPAPEDQFEAALGGEFLGRAALGNEALTPATLVHPPLQLRQGGRRDVQSGHAAPGLQQRERQPAEATAQIEHFHARARARELEEPAAHAAVEGRLLPVHPGVGLAPGVEVPPLGLDPSRVRHACSRAASPSLCCRTTPSTIRFSTMDKPHCVASNSQNMATTTRDQCTVTV